MWPTRVRRACGSRRSPDWSRNTRISKFCHGRAYNSDPANQTDGELRQANDIVFNLPNHQGLGTFFWEPTRDINAANLGIFTVAQNVYTPIPACIDQYDLR